MTTNDITPQLCQPGCLAAECRQQLQLFHENGTRVPYATVASMLRLWAESGAMCHNQDLLMGGVRTLGEFGPAYRIGPVSCQADNGDWLIWVQLLVSGENIEYELSHILQDPEAKQPRQAPLEAA